MANRCGQVAEWLKAADCKSARASVRWFESSPVHHNPPKPLVIQWLEKGLPFGPFVHLSELHRTYSVIQGVEASLLERRCPDLERSNSGQAAFSFFCLNAVILLTTRLRTSCGRGNLTGMTGAMKLLILVLAIGAGAAVAATVSDDTMDFEVAGNRYEVPKDHLFEMAIPWLPQPDSDSFTFLFQPNPASGSIPKHRVLVQRLSRLCPTDAETKATQMLRVACGQEAASVMETPPFVKMRNELGSWSSDLYAIAKEPGREGVLNKRQIAYCQFFEPNPAKPEPSNLCTTFWAYKGMLLKFSFDESESSEMPAMKARAMALLDSWEVR